MNNHKTEMAAVKLCIALLMLTLVYPCVSFATPVPIRGRPNVMQHKMHHKKFPVRSQANISTDRCSIHFNPPSYTKLAENWYGVA